MTHDELVALRDALDVVLALPDSLRKLLAQWLTPAAAKPNGDDPRPPVPTPPPRAVKVSAARRAEPTSAKTAERELIAAMRAYPGLSVIALANAAGSSRSATGERLRRLAARGLVEKDATGRWKLKREEPRPLMQGKTLGPQQPSPS
jgi:hypothetical protein